MASSSLSIKFHPTRLISSSKIFIDRNYEEVEVECSSFLVDNKSCNTLKICIPRAIENKRQLLQRVCFYKTCITMIGFTGL